MDLPVQAGEALALSLYFDRDPPVSSYHWDGRRDAYLLAGNQTANPDPKVVEKSHVRLFVSSIHVDRTRRTPSIVVLGDSITDGAGATFGQDTRWPDYLSQRAAPRGIAVINAGISGARLLDDGMGERAASRFEPEVLAQNDVRLLIVALGINDIAWPGTPFAKDAPPMTFERLTAGYRELVERAHQRGLKVAGATLAPFAGALPGTPMGPTYHSPEKDSLRQRVNQWIRTSKVFDAVIDFDVALRDPSKPSKLRAVCDSGDHLHPGDAGNATMAALVDLDIVTTTPCQERLR